MSRDWTDEDRLERRKRSMSLSALRELLEIEHEIFLENLRRAAEDDTREGSR